MIDNYQPIRSSPSQVIPNVSLFDRSFSFWLVALSLPLLFLPKINLISLGSRESAGLRIDDFILFVFLIVVFWARSILKTPSSYIEKRFIYFFIFSLFSFVSNKILSLLGILHVHSVLFYCLRLPEYFLFFYIGMLCFQFISLKKIINCFFIWNLLIMVGQKMGVIGHFTVDGYVASRPEYVSGIASFPSEAGALINMVFCFFIFQEKSKQETLSYFRSIIEVLYPYLIFLICIIAVVFTGSRLSIFALIVTFLFRLKEDLKQFSPFAWGCIALFVVFGAILTAELITHTAMVFERSKGLISFKNLSLIEVVWENIDVSLIPIDNEAVPYEEYDMSWWLRIQKWCYALKIYYLHPECYLQGIGPGFAMSALDGGYLRLLTEYGIIGVYLFWRFISSIYHQTEYLRWMVVAFLINMVFFDVYLAYKPMSLLFLTSGLAYMESVQSLRASSYIEECPKI